MFNDKVSKKKVIVISVLIMLALVIINIFCKNTISLWSLSLIPTILLLQVFPQWKTGLLSFLIVSIIELVIESYIFYNLTTELKVNLLVNFVVNFNLTILLTYFRVKNVNMLLTDPLTGAYNRKFYNIYLSSNKNKKNMSIQVIDIDHFKNVNDTYGHSCGDFILSEIVKVIKSNIRKTDHLIRLGGEEFIVLSQETNKDDLETMATRICKEVEETEFVYEQQKIDITVSIGLSQMQEDQDFDCLFKKADEALYLSKQNGRNRVSYV